MESVLYNIIEYGANPCVLKLVSISWMYSIDEIDSLIIQRVQWRIPDKPLPYIAMMLLDAFDITMAEKMILHSSIPIVDWNVVPYMIENIDIAKMLISRVRNRHTKEMCRRLGIEIPIPKKEIFKISSTIGGQTSTAGLKSISSIIASGYLDALKILLEKAERTDSDSSISIEQLFTLINTSLAMLLQNEVPINPCIPRWLCNNKKYKDCVPDGIYYMCKETNMDIYLKDYLMMRVSIDKYHPKIRMIPLNIFHQLGKNILNNIAQVVTMCKNYVLACLNKKESFAANIRVIDAIIRHCRNKTVRDAAVEIAINNGWDSYIVIAEDEE